MMVGAKERGDARYGFPSIWCGVDGGGFVQKVPKVYRCEGREDAIQKKLRWPSLSEGPSGYLMVLCPLTSI